MRAARLSLAAVLLTGALALPHAQASPVPGRAVLHAQGAWLVDAAGRTRLFHGVNVVYKHPPYVPSPAQMNDADARLMRELGFNVVRLGIIWKGLEPERGRFDERYLDRIAGLVELFERHGIHTLLDFHQDIYNERYGGEGFPDWAVFDDGLWTGAEPSVFTGWASRYLTPGVSRAFDNFWENREGIQDAFLDAWVHVARRFANDPWVIGYDLLNEPWVGTVWPAFQTPVAETTRLRPFYQRAIEAIRRVDRRHTIWWEPSVVNNFGAANGMGAAPALRDPSAIGGPNLGMSFHVYCIAGETVAPGADNNSPACETLEERAWDEQAVARRRTGHTWFLSEFAATDDLAEVATQAARADDHLTGWAYWSWKYYDDPTGAVNEGLIENDTGPPRLKRPKALVLSRPFPHAVAGRPLHLEFDPQTGAFELVWAVLDVPGPTEIFVPARLHYPGGYRVSIEGAARVVSGPNAGMLRVANTGGGIVTLRIRPA